MTREFASFTKLVLFSLLFFINIAVAWQTAASQVVDSIYYDWSVYEYAENEEDGKICYIISFPKSSKTDYSATRTPYLSVTRYASTKKEEISVYSGYEYKLNSPVYMLLSDKQFKLFTDSDFAWTINETFDKEIIQLMLKSPEIKIRSDSSLGNYSVDTYSTRGLTRAYSRMKQICS